jgi:hypothetical protein
VKPVNRRLREIEDRIRAKEAKEKAKQFDAEFIELAHSVYFANDERSDTKRGINLAAGSSLVEEKDHVDYGRDRGEP